MSSSKRAGLGFSDRSISGMTAIFSHNSRSHSDETTEAQPLALDGLEADERRRLAGFQHRLSEKISDRDIEAFWNKSVIDLYFGNGAQLRAFFFRRCLRI